MQFEKVLRLSSLCSFLVLRNIWKVSRLLGM